MAVLRMIILAIAIALGTVLVSWWVVPLVAAVYGVLSRRTRLPGLTAAASGALAWGGYLAIVSLGGGSVAGFGTALGTSMQLPGWAPLLATLLFPAVLAGCAAYLGARAGSRYLSAA